MGKSVIATKISLALGLILAMIFGTAPVGAFAAVIRTTYIVQVQDGYANDVRAAIGRLGETPHDELTEVMDGFVIDLTDTEVAALRLEPYVIQVVQDMPMGLMDTQSPTPSWGLDRIDQTTTAGDNAYNFPASAGSGVRIYVVDTGVMASNPDFAGRILPGIDMYGQNLETADCHGHGTHVAGTAAGTKYGVAKKASIVPVRVLSCTGSGSWSYFISAMDWIIANNPAGTPAVMSASIGGGNYPLANAAVEKLYAAGITPVIAAGNSNVDACGTSPAGAPNAITVGASDIADARASFSNWGECVDVFAPGVNIISDKNTDPTGSTSMSGTSMATPHVSGLAALYLSGNQAATPAQVTSAIKAGGLAGAVANAQSTLGNILINNNFTRASVPVAPAPVYPPTAVTATAITSNSATISWTAPAVSATATAPESYKVEYKLVTDTAWQSLTTGTTSASITGLTYLSNYVVRVTSIAGTQVSEPTGELQFSTLGTAPDAPTNLNAVTIYGNQIDLNWNRPNTNGANITGYYLEWLVNGNWTNYATVVSSATSVNASVKNLTPLTSYSFRIRAYNPLGASLPSNVLTVSTSQATPVTPSAIVLSSITGTTATASWKASPQIDPAVPITYVVRIYSRMISNYGAILGTYNATSNSYVVTGLKRTTAYSLSVTAISGTASSPTSGLVTFSTTASKAGAPSQTNAAKTSTGFNLSWAYPADDGGSAVTGYQLEQQATDGSWSVIATLAATVLSYSVPAPARATAVNYRIAASNALGLGDYAAITVSTPADLPGAPQTLTVTRGTGGSVLAWTAPVENGGSPITFYTVYRSADNGVTWTALNTVVTATTWTVPVPAKGVKYLYAVAARNITGTGVKSNSVADETLATAPAPVRAISFSYPVANKLQINWTAPADNGGSAITGYLLERQLANGAWTLVNDGNVLSFQIDRDLPGVLVNVRVTAKNAIGSSSVLAASWRTPFVKASAPQNFTAVDNGTSVVLAWAAPADLGGSSISNYQLQVSKDGGVTWLGYATLNASATTALIPRPTKGTTWSYRLLASTGFGLSDASNSASVTAAITVPGPPSIRSLVFAADGSMSLAWYLPSDNGGTALTGIVIERSSDNVTWVALAPLAANAVTASFARELPGVRSYFRVKAVNSVGVSNSSSVASLMTPYVKASAPQNFSATDTGTAVAVSWEAPASLGGSTVSQYIVWISKDAGTTWAATYYVGSTVNKVSLPRPAKGQNWQYRMTARTAFGDSESTAVVTIAAALTVASAPQLRGLVVNSDGTLTASWLAPSDAGGTAVTGYLVERSVDNVNWVALATVPATQLALTFPGGGAGVRSYIRIKAINSVGSSLASSVATAQVPYLKASAPTGLAATFASGRVQLTWAAPANTGGSAVSQYQVEYSANGSTWNVGAYSTSLTAVLPAAAKGQAFGYRVTARTLAGLGEYSALVSVTTPNTAASAVRLNSAISTGAGTFNLTFSAPSDLGGYTGYSYRVEVFVNNAWTPVATGVGAAVNVVALTTASRTTTYTYRVVATNPSGDSSAASFNYRG